MIERWLSRADGHARQLRVIAVFWAASAVLFGIGGAVFAASGRDGTERIAPWWIAMAAVGLAAAALFEFTRRAVKNRAGRSMGR
jgi:hypothetical protein